MKVSFIICTSSTKDFVKYDPKSWPERDYELEECIDNHVNSLLEQICKIPVDKEIILVDNTYDFKQTFYDDCIKIVPGFGYLLENDAFDFEKFSHISDLKMRKNNKIIKNKKIKVNHTESNALSLNIGLQHVKGDYIILQHNDSSYLPSYYGSYSFIEDSIELLEQKGYEFITVDKKPDKDVTPKHIPYFNDAYWFLCRSDFYKKHGIWVDWLRGDCNHLATITCYEKNLPYLNLPGYYESDPMEAKAWLLYNKKYFEPEVETNIHYLNGKPFFEHHKGGTGLRNTLKRKKWGLS